MEEAVGVKLIEDDNFPQLQAWIQNFKAVPVIKENLPDHNEMLTYFKQRRDVCCIRDVINICIDFCFCILGLQLGSF